MYMKEWDDYYHELIEKGRRPNIGAALESYKRETVEFYKAWAQAEAKGSIYSRDCWGNDPECD